MAETVPAVELRSVTKRYGRVVANDSVSLRVEQGHVHAIVGENGAGKSTLMKILAGVTQPDSGEVWVNGKRQRFGSPRDAIDAGIGMVFQHFRLVQAFTVAENVLLGNEGRAVLRPVAMQKQVAELAEHYGFYVRPEALVESLSVGEQQRVEILKVLHREARIIILDEPTAVLTPGEVDQFFDTVRALRDGGATVIFITHKLQEVMALCDRVTVLRRGKAVGEFAVAKTSAQDLASLMVGGDGTEPMRYIEEEIRSDTREVVLEVRSLVPETTGKGAEVSRGISLAVAAGEIVGMAGVEGNGQSELVESLVGLRRVNSGQVWFGGNDVSRWSVKARRQAGMAFIPEDRQRHGLVMDFTLAENLMLGRHFAETRLPAGTGRRAMAELLAAYDVRPAEPGRLARELSGGNQQKLVVAREISRGAPLLIASQPTRGVDLAAVRAIHEHLRAQRASGAAVLLVSSDLEEILELSDRVLVMYRGRIVFKAENAGLDERLLGWYMAGGDSASGHAGEA